ncbi:hypothetical protein EOF33_18895 [Salmonella enterica]|nr:hypothetical protein [Salmonella enterica]
MQCASTTSICSRPGCCCGIKDSFRNGKRSSCTVITARTGCEKTAQASSDRKNVGNGRKGGTVTNGAIVIHTQRLKSDPGGNLLS